MFGEAPFRKCEDCYTKRCEHPQFPGNSYPYDYQFRINRDNVCDPFPGHAALPTKPGSSVGGSVQQRGEYRGAFKTMEKQEGKPWRRTPWGPMRWWFWVLVWGGTQDYGELVVMVCPSSYLGFLQLGFLKGSQSGSTNRIQRKGMNQKHKCPKPEDEFMLFCLQLQSS